MSAQPSLWDLLQQRVAQHYQSTLSPNVGLPRAVFNAAVGGAFGLPLEAAQHVTGDVVGSLYQQSSQGTGNPLDQRIADAGNQGGPAAALAAARTDPRNSVSLTAGALDLLLNPVNFVEPGAGLAERAGLETLAHGVQAYNAALGLPFRGVAKGVGLLRGALPEALVPAAESAERVPLVPARAPNLAQLAQGRGAVPPAPPVFPPLPEALAPTRAPSLVGLAQAGQPATVAAPSAALAAAAPAAESGLTDAERAYLAKYNIPESAVAGSRPALDALASAPEAPPPPPPVSLPTPPANAPREAAQGATGAPGWLQQELANRNDLAARLGLGDAIERLSAQRLTAAQVAAALRAQFPERTAGLVGKGINDDLLGLVRAVRAARGIPSLDDATAFEAWLAGRAPGAPQEAAQAATGALPEAPPAPPAGALDRLLAYHPSAGGDPALWDRLAAEAGRRGIPGQAIDEALAARQAANPLTDVVQPATRAEGLAALSGRDTNTLLGLAYDHPNAVANAQRKYADVGALRARAIERIQADRGRVERLAATDPDLAARVAALPDAEVARGLSPDVGATPAATRDLPAGALPAPPATNYRTALSDYTDRLYHETDPEGASFLLEGQVSRPEMFYSNTPDLALGQGGRGVLLELAPEGIEGQINKKPGWQVSWEQAGGAEFRDRLPSGPTIRDNIRSVTIQPGLNVRDPYLRRMQGLLSREGWQPAMLDDGATRYTRPPAPATGGGDIAAGGGGGGMMLVSPLAAPIRAAQTALPIARGIHDIAWANLVDANTGEAARSTQGAVPEFLAQMRAMRTTGPYTFLRNSIGAGWSLALKSPAAVPLFRDNIAEGLGAIPQLSADLRAIRARPDLTDASRAQSVAEAYGKLLPSETRALLAPHGPDAIAAYIDAIGENWAARDLPAALRVGAAKGAAMGAAAGLASPYTAVVGPLSAGVSALAGAALPYTKTAQNLVLGTVETAARDAAARPVLAEALAAGRPVEEAIAAAGAAAKDTFGDYSDRGRLLGLLNSFFPGIDWNVEQTGVLARRAAEHPAVAMGLLAAMLREAKAHQLDPENAGTIRVGPVNVNPLYPETPIGPEALTVPRTLAREPNAPLLDKIHALTSAAGLYTSPLLDVPAYALGAQQRAPASSERLLPAAEYLDATLGLPRVVNPVGAPLEALHQLATGGQATNPLDTQAALNAGTYRDPRVLRAGAEIVQEETGAPLSARANVERATELLDSSSDLYRRAQQRALGSKAAEAAANFVTGVPIRVQTETARTAERVAGALPSPEQVALVASPNRAVREKALAALPDYIQRPPATLPASQQAAVVQAQVDALRAGVPGGNVYQGATEQGLGEAAMKRFDQRLGPIEAIAPRTFALLRAQEQERLGLAPQGGTAASRQSAYDQALLAGYLMSPIGTPLGGLPPSAMFTPRAQGGLPPSQLLPAR